MKRTTIVLNQNLERRLKQRAHAQSTTMTALITAYIRDGLNRTTKEPAMTEPFVLPSFDMGAATVDPAERNRLWDLMDKQ